MTSGKRLGLGIDISKDKVDFALSDGTLQGRLPRTRAGLDELAGRVRDCELHRVVLEATGGYERLVLEVLHIHELPVVMVKPQRARYFARALGQRAKTDAIDAAVLAQMAVMAVDNVPLWTAPTADQAELRALHKRRAQLVEILGAEKKRLAHAEAVVRGSFEAVIQMLESQKKEIGHRMEELVAASAQLAPKIRAMTQVCGVGFQTAAALLAQVPELGTLDRRQVAALIGVAPITRQSGSWSGYAYTGGGRAAARKALYMAALTARRHNSHIRSFYEGLVDRGKPKKVALVACMRKLAIHLNSILRRQAGQNA